MDQLKICTDLQCIYLVSLSDMSAADLFQMDSADFGDEE